MCVPICWVAVTCSTIQLTLLRPQPAGPASGRRRLIWWALVVRYCRNVRPGKAGMSACSTCARS